MCQSSRSATVNNPQHGPFHPMFNRAAPSPAGHIPTHRAVEPCADTAEDTGWTFLLLPFPRSHAAEQMTITPLLLINPQCHSDQLERSRSALVTDALVAGPAWEATKNKTLGRAARGRNKIPSEKQKSQLFRGNEKTAQTAPWPPRCNVSRWTGLVLPATTSTSLVRKPRRGTRGNML